MLKLSILSKFILLISLQTICVFKNGCFSQVSIQMTRQGGVSVIPCKLNGLTLDFIFDSGASDVTISLTEATFMLKNGYLSYNDIVGSEKYRTASGEISEGIKINLREIEFGGFKLRNVEATIIKTSNAPLLLGQSALSKLGNIIVNFETNVLTIKSPATAPQNKTNYPINNFSKLSNNQILKVYKSNPLFYKSCSIDYLKNSILELLQNNVRPNAWQSDLIYSFKNNYLVESTRAKIRNGSFLNLLEGFDIKNLAETRIQSIKLYGGIISLEMYVYGNNSMKNSIYENGEIKLKDNGTLSKDICEACTDKDIRKGLIITLFADSWNKDLSKILSICLNELSKRLGNKSVIKNIVLD